MGLHLRRLPTLLLLVVLLAAMARGDAAAQGLPRVAVLRFEGAPRLQAAVVDVLSKEHHVVPLSEWEATARELDATGYKSDEIAIVAQHLRVRVAVTGIIRKDERGQWAITVAARNGRSGRTVEKVRLPIRSASTSREALAFIGPAVERALLEAPPESQEPDLPPDRSPDRPSEEPDRPPGVYPLIDASVGFLFGGRRLDFDEELGRSPVGCYDFRQPIVDPAVPDQIVHQFTNRLGRCPRFPTAVTGGLRVDVTLYPLARRKSRFYRQLGVGLTADIPLWPPTATCQKNNPDDPCMGSQALQTREFRVEAGLRYALNLLDRRDRVTLLFSLHYGAHGFSLEKTSKEYEYFDPRSTTRVVAAGVDDRGLPDVLYQYLSLGVGARVPYYATPRWSIGLLLDVRYHAMLAFGEIERRFNDESSFSGLYQGGGYGPVGSGHGLRVAATPIEWTPWRGLTLRLSGHYELFRMNFEIGESFFSGSAPVEPQNLNPGDSARHIARGAQDQYFGGVVQAGWQY